MYNIIYTYQIISVPGLSDLPQLPTLAHIGNFMDPIPWTWT